MLLELVAVSPLCVQEALLRVSLACAAVGMSLLTRSHRTAAAVRLLVCEFESAGVAYPLACPHDAEVCAYHLETRSQWWTTYLGNYRALGDICAQEAAPVEQQRVAEMYRNATAAYRALSEELAVQVQQASELSLRQQEALDDTRQQLVQLVEQMEAQAARHHEYRSGVEVGMRRMVVAQDLAVSRLECLGDLVAAKMEAVTRQMAAGWESETQMYIQRWEGEAEQALKRAVERGVESVETVVERAAARVGAVVLTLVTLQQLVGATAQHAVQVAGAMEALVQEAAAGLENVRELEQEHARVHRETGETIERVQAQMLALERTAGVVGRRYWWLAVTVAGVAVVGVAGTESMRWIAVAVAMAMWW